MIPHSPVCCSMVFFCVNLRRRGLLNASPVQRVNGVLPWLSAQALYHPNKMHPKGDFLPTIWFFRPNEFKRALRRCIVYFIDRDDRKSSQVLVKIATSV